MVLLLGGRMAYAQKEEVATIPSDSMQVAVMQNNLNKITWNTDPLSPAKAAFYSAVIPGLGQIYNKSYWKVPLVYIAIGTPIYSTYKTLKNTIVTSLPTNVVNKDLPMMNFMALPPVDNLVSVPMD